MEVKRWEINVETGNLLYDREFALVDNTGVALRLSRHPKMGSIRPQLDLEGRTLTVTAPRCQKLVINLDDDLQYPMNDVKVCGTNCDGKLWGSHSVSSWFSEYLGVQCWLARANITRNIQSLKDEDEVSRPLMKKRYGFENDAPILLLSTKSLDILNNQLRSRGFPEVNAKYFRPNLVVTSEEASGNMNPEDYWETITITRTNFKMVAIGQCARCSMVDVDPESGMRGKTLSTLAQYRRNKGQITFGIFLKVKDNRQNSSVSTLWIESGELLRAERM